MRKTTTSTANPCAEYKTGTPDWLSCQTSQYALEQPVYKKYADTLTEILERAGRKLAPLAIVQARPKSISSFAEKAVRKTEKYDDPVHQLTDLCGARIIVHTQDQAASLNDFIREHFRVDEANTIDVATRLRPSEFGYLSMHFVVQVGDGEIEGVKIPADIGDRKAEIQVRTLLQHAWSDISHDRLYKNSATIPERWHREAARVAAVLEDADQILRRFAAGVDAYNLHYGVFLNKDEREKEIKALETILANEPLPDNKPSIALRVARVARLSWNWKKVQDALKLFKDRKCPEQPEILAEHGHALCRLHRRTPDSRTYTRGVRELEKASDAAEGRIRAEALRYLAWACEVLPDQNDRVRELLSEALELDPENPYILAEYLEFEILCGAGTAFVGRMRHAVRTAISKCRDHAAAGIELPWAYFAMGRFHLLLGERNQSLSAYAKAVRLCAREATCVPADVIESERAFLRRINPGAALPEEHLWVEWLLLIAEASLPRAPATPGLPVLRQGAFKPPVVIVAGGTHPDVQDRMSEYQKCIEAAFEGFTGTIISGGTRAGIPGIVGGVAEKLNASAAGSVDVIGYIPHLLPDDAPRDDRYTELIVTEGAGFTPREPLQNWIDLIAAGVKPGDIKVLGINGGPITALEYRFALAFGATVGVIESSGREASKLFPDADWGECPNLLMLPFDAMTVRAFVNPGTPPMTAEQLEAAGQVIHEEFLLENRYTKVDPVMLPWAELREDLKEDNRQQAAYSVEVLGKAGYRVGALSATAVKKFPDDQVEMMAEMEHGRWVVRRLTDGWRYGTRRDPDTKTSPYLVPWADLPEKVKDYDRLAIRRWPALLEKAGLGIHPK